MRLTQSLGVAKQEIDVAPPRCIAGAGADGNQEQGGDHGRPFARDLRVRAKRTVTGAPGAPYV